MKYKIYSYSVLHSSTVDFAEKTPYIVAIVEDETGARQSAFVEGWREGIQIQIGGALIWAGEDEAGRARFALADK